MISKFFDVPESVELVVEVEQDKFTAKVSEAFDYEFDGITRTTIPAFKVPISDFRIGVIVGSSGSGKTQILKHHFGYTDPDIKWYTNKAIISHFPTPDIALDKLFAAGLASIPTLCKPFHILSEGEKYRAMVARMIEDEAVIDEYTSTVNRETAKSLSVSLRKYVDRVGLKSIVIATCHTDIIEFLHPDWVFDCDTSRYGISEDRQMLTKKAEITIYA